MAIQFIDQETLVKPNANSNLDKVISSLGKDDLKALTTSKDVSGIEVRMMAPYIKDNRTPRVFPFPGYAKIYCLTIVVSDQDNQLVGSIDLKGFPRIDDRESLPINKTIFYWQTQDESLKAPSQIHLMTTVLKSKQALRDVGSILSKVKSDEEYKGLIGTLASFSKDSMQFSSITDVITQIAGVVGKHLGDVEDKPLGTLITSYTSLYGDFDNVGVHSLTYPTKYVDFNFKLIVRSKVNDGILNININEQSNSNIISNKTEQDLMLEENVKLEMMSL